MISWSVIGYLMSMCHVQAATDKQISLLLFQGWGPLHCAAVTGHVELVKMLLDACNPSDIDATDSQVKHSYTDRDYAPSQICTQCASPQTQQRYLQRLCIMPWTM